MIFPKAILSYGLKPLPLKRKCFNGWRNCGGTLWGPTVVPGFKIYDLHYRLTDEEEEVCLSSLESFLETLEVLP
jgi:hypothetical protein